MVSKRLCNADPESAVDERRVADVHLDQLPLRYIFRKPLDTTAVS